MRILMKPYTVYLLLVLALALGCKGRASDSSKARRGVTDKRWLGKWQRNLRMNEASLDITGFNGDSLQFTLFASSGGNMGEVDGSAEVRGRKAYFSVEDCEMEFELLGDSAIILQQEEGLCFAGLGVTYSGIYINEKYLQAKKEEDLEDLGLLDKSADSLLRQLTGSDYDLFVKSTQLSSENEDLDKFGAKVLASGVRGLFTTMENMIIYTPKGDMWAAVINLEPDSVFKDKMNGKVYYYTNRADYAQKLPRTIDQWRSRFSDYEVKYKSAQQAP